MNGGEPRPEARVSGPAEISEVQRLHWLVRRELWENRALYLAPLSAAGVILFGFLISTIHLPSKMRAVLAMEAAKQHRDVVLPYDFAAFLILLTAFVVGIFYALEALHGERRDRSILFWKSLPVSDLTTVLSKMCIPLVVLPLISFVIIVATQTVMLAWSTLVLAASGVSSAALWRNLPLLSMSLALFYCLLTIALWHAPIYAWLLLISAWAKRATFLWAVLPVLGMGAFEKGALGSAHFLNWVKYRLIGWFLYAVANPQQSPAPVNPLLTLTPGRFLSSPGLWAGLASAAVFLALAVRLRRYREPL